MAWQFDTASRRFRSTESGKYLSRQQAVALRDRFTDLAKERAAALATDLKAGTLDAAGWERSMRALAKSVHVDMALLGRGGRPQMMPADWGRVGAALKSQYRYLGAFADQAGELTEAQVAARAGMYVAAATNTYERASAAAAGVPDLPAYPGDDCEGMANCRCFWEIVETEDGWECTWHVVGDEGTCEPCAEHGREWAPLVVERAVEERVAA